MVGWQRSVLVLGEALEGNYSWPLQFKFSFREKAMVRFVFLFGVWFWISLLLLPTQHVWRCVVVPHYSSATSIDLCTSLKTWFRKLHKPWISCLELLLSSDLQICTRLTVPDVAFLSYLPPKSCSLYQTDSRELAYLYSCECLSDHIFWIKSCNILYRIQFKGQFLSCVCVCCVHSSNLVGCYTFFFLLLSGPFSLQMSVKKN